MVPFWIRILQLVSIGFMWVFSLGVLAFVVWLIIVAARWQDAMNWTLAISIVMTPVYLTVAGVLTYVFFGLRSGSRKEGSPDGTDSKHAEVVRTPASPSRSG